MKASALDIKLPLVWGSAILIFFFNSFLLPEGLTISLLLTPVWIYMLYRHNQLQTFGGIVLLLGIYACIHFLLGVQVRYYAVSFTLLAATISFVLVALHIVRSGIIDWDLVFKDLVLMNFVLAMLCLPFLFVPFLKPYLEQVWYLNSISKNIEYIPRLKLFTPEASHYSLLLAPLAIYFTTRALFQRTKYALPTLTMIAIPMLMSFSLGVITVLLVSGLIVVLFNLGRIFRTPKRIIVFLVLVVAAGAALYLLYLFSPDNPLFIRLQNIISGNDTSSKGRTYEAFIIAHQVAAEKSLVWGIGPGQLKLLGRDLIAKYYNYMTMPDVVRIPNATAETLACFGYAGLALRLGAEIVLFFRTRLFRNPYRLWLFLFIFIYQFTGSYITNVSEYLIWVFVFCPIFPDLTPQPREQMTNNKITTRVVE